MRGMMIRLHGLSPMTSCYGNGMTGLPCQNRTRSTPSSPTPRLARSRTLPLVALLEAPVISNQLAFNSSPVTRFMLTTLIASGLAPGIIRHVPIVVIDSLPLMCSFTVQTHASSVFDVDLFPDTILPFFKQSLAPPNSASFFTTLKRCCVPFHRDQIHHESPSLLSSFVGPCVPFFRLLIFYWIFLDATASLHLYRLHVLL